MSKLKELVSKGFLVDDDAKEAVDKLNEEQFEKLLDVLKKENPFMVSKSLIKNIFREEIKILKNFKRKEVMSIKDFVNSLNKRYSVLQKILMEKMEMKEMVSINKCGTGRNSLIGMVKSIEDKGDNLEVFLEDPTGELKTAIAKTIGGKISLDDVIAVSGIANNKLFFVDKVLFPDVSFRPVKYSANPVKIGFISEEKNLEADYLIMKDKIKDVVKKKEYNITAPVLVEISDVKILILDKDPLKSLKKRYLKKGDQEFIIDIIPDIILSMEGEDKNYKGTTIVTPGKIIDLKTREINKIL